MTANLRNVARSVAALVALGTLLGAAASARGGERSLELAGLRVTEWSRKLDDVSAEPVIVFSHGFHGCATQSRFLMEALADAGFLVLAPNHRDATCNGGTSRWIDRPATPFGDAEAWNDTTYRDRGDDIRRLIDAARSDDRFRRADWSRLGLAGHSLGGYTVLGLAGAWPTWKLGGVKAVLALSPHSQPFLAHDTLGGLSTPVMYQGGTLDFGVTPSLDKNQGAYERSPEPKYLLVLDKAGHFAWTDVGKKSARPEIVAYSLAFLNHYVKGEPAGALLTSPSSSASRFRHPAEP